MFSKKVFCGATSPRFPPGIAAARASAENPFALLARQADTVACGVKRRDGEARAHDHHEKKMKEEEEEEEEEEMKKKKKKNEEEKNEKQKKKKKKKKKK
ncbi:hypothetical protein KOW79_002886 [Hemibagrus wyckioides]|uniref:Uncharacterized protein n=1 Tax=Hemibagrus wyckioides TaxID=337641 RepID=A0A9D3P5J6_9TELE|nr:hypothetical protein KOW79_002886 [Hemibagrus wyckioides]